MDKWQKILGQSATEVGALRELSGPEKKKLIPVAKRYPMRANPYYRRLIQAKNDPIWKQCMPDIKETSWGGGQVDPLREEYYSPIKGLVHRYPDRVLLLASNVCATYCRFCTRKRNVGMEYTSLSEKDFKAAMRYIEKHKGIQDVIISGGDPLLLDDRVIEKYLKAITAIKHVKLIRIDSRVICTLPQRITPKLCRILKKYNPVYLLTHFNHPREVTKEAAKAANMLADAGIVLGNQSVLLKGINDAPKVLRELYLALLRIRIRPYYLYMPDAVRGTSHFRVSIDRGLKIMKALIGHTSGLAIPKLILDMEHGGGKIPLRPEYLVKRKGKAYVFKNFEDRVFHYQDI